MSGVSQFLQIKEGSFKSPKKQKIACHLLDKQA
jgi:hypothetical protein